MNVYDFLQVDTVDLNGLSRSKIIPKRCMPSALDHGVAMFCGVQACGYHSENPIFADTSQRGYGNGLLQIDPSTVVHKKWSTDQYKLGHVLAEMHWFDQKGGNPQPHAADPRSTARKVLAELRKNGFSLYSAFEYEFKLLHASTLEPFVRDHQLCYSLSFHQKVMELLMSMSTHLDACGVAQDCLQRELGHGQVEIPLLPEFGLKAADNAIRFKSVVKEIALQNHFVATFMSKPFAQDSGVGAHFNFSLWNAEETKNVLYDEQAGNHLSEVGRHWLAGIVQHLPGMMAILCPTSNCYRRLRDALIPRHVVWGFENRVSSIRVKNHSERDSYFENRLAAGPVNAYLVLAATVIAGLDGIQRKLTLPADNVPLQPLPTTLAEALDALEGDSVLMDKLGCSGKWFVQIKRKVDLKLFENHNLNEDKEEELKAERDYFLQVT